MAIKLALALLACIGTAQSACAQDVWANFHADSVKRISCQVSPVDLMTRDGKRDTDYWMASAKAWHTDAANEDWGFTLSEYPISDDGMRKAMHDCQEWTIEAGKRIKEAQKEILKEELKKQKEKAHEK